MTTIFAHPSEFSDDQLTGFADLYADRLRRVVGGVVALAQGPAKVAVVVGGGSGHYPAFAGLVGPGFAAGAVVGNIFTSPSAAHVYSVAKAADQGRGVILTFGNYAGDIMNFGIAAQRLNAEGIDTRIVVVTDDVASADQEEKRRGIAGDFTVFKVLSAAAEEGLEIGEVERLGREANAKTRTLGVAFSGCTMPGSKDPLFTVPAGHVGLGLGIHGEPGIRDEPMPDAGGLASMLVEGVLEHAPEGAGSRVGVILNGLGTTKYEELFLLWGLVAPALRSAGLEIVDPEVGELVTSLDMGGVSLTLMWLGDHEGAEGSELERLWRADAYAAAYRKQARPLERIEASKGPADEVRAEEELAPASEESRELAGELRAASLLIEELIREKEKELGQIDAIAGDGDHGRGMLKGVNAANKALETLSDSAGAQSVLVRAGMAWAEYAGGTSGVLWGAGLEAAGRSLGDDAGGYGLADACKAVEAFTRTIEELGGAKAGDKTLVDALLPFLARLGKREDQEALVSAWSEAAAEAAQAAEGTAHLVPKLGRARPLAEKSLGHPDAGAVSLAMILQRISQYLKEKDS